MTPGKTLKTYREMKKITQVKLGELVGVTTARISDFETGQLAISKAMAKKLAEVFGTSPARFI